MVIQRSGKGAQPYEEEAKKAGLGQIHGAVYWNMFGKGQDPGRAVGEGFSVTIGSKNLHSPIKMECSGESQLSTHHNSVLK